MTKASRGPHAAYGSWRSPISARSLVEGVREPTEVVVDGRDVWWAEQRPDEGGRTALVRWRDGDEVAPGGPVNARTLAHEYGGGAWWAAGGVLVWSEYDDQRLYRLGPDDEAPVALTVESSARVRYADGRITPDGARYVCVRERHSDGHREPANEIVAVALDGSGDVESLVSGPDFVASPRVSPDGGRLVWVQWRHPNMPWDDTELWAAELDGSRVGDARRLAGEPGESVVQPRFAPDGRLFVVSDRSDWWGLYEVTDVGLEPVRVVDGEEMAEPGWVFGQLRHAALPDGELVVAPVTGPTQRLLSTPDDRVLLDAMGRISNPQPFSEGSVVALVVGVDHGPAVARVSTRGGAVEWCRAPHAHGFDAGYLPAPERLTFPTAASEVAHAYYYAPANASWSAPPGARPPLIVLAHAGPTSAARGELQLGLRYWTSRGFAVVDVDYRGSTGYGRRYRRALYGRWGVVDVEDCVAAVGHLVARGDVDPDRVAIRGGSAGGFTVLRALVESSVFTAGVSRYGVADLEALATDTHKFESRYLDQLIGPYPERRDLYVERSPVHHVERLSVPMLVMQGLDDAVVPPNQSEAIVAALEANGIAVAYLTFEGEGHGFRRAETIVTALETELAFYGDVFGFEPADVVVAVPWRVAPDPNRTER